MSYTFISEVFKAVHSNDFNPRLVGDTFEYEVFVPSQGEGTETPTLVSSQRSMCTQSSRSSLDEVPTRPSHDRYWALANTQANVLESMEKKCACTRSETQGVSCATLFNYEKYMNLRRHRQVMDPSQEYELRTKELTTAFQLSPDRPLVKVGCPEVPHKFVCIQAYIIILGLPKSSVWRKWAKISGNQSVRRAGLTVTQDHTLAWLINWSNLIVDEDPVGSDYLKVIDLVTVPEMYSEYVVDFKAFHISTQAKPISERGFRRVWYYWLNKYRVRVRKKKNVTTKCDGGYTLPPPLDFSFLTCQLNRMRAFENACQ